MYLGSLLTILLVLVVVGFLLWLFNTKAPIDATFKTIINFIVVVFVVVWLLNVFGIFDLHVGPIHHR